jgi:putative acetyltransferase
MRIMAEEPRHRPAVLEVSRRAFKGEAEAQLIEALDRDGQVIASLVAVDGDEVSGHILFSRLDVEVEAQPIRAAALAPMAVLPDRQRQGIGTALVNRGLAELRAQGVEAVSVVGHPDYYRRFGFRHDLVADLASPFTQYDAFMGLELLDGALAGRPGACRYPKAFGLT